jgi:hypothetical protein
MKTRTCLFFLFAFLIFSFASGQKAAPCINGHQTAAGTILQKMTQPSPGTDFFQGQLITPQQPELDRLIDSIYQYDWSSPDWMLKTKDHKYHNSNGQLTEDRIEKKNQSGKWNNYVHFLYTYNGAAPDYLTSLGEIWTSAGTWAPYQYTHNHKTNLPDTTWSREWNTYLQTFISGTEMIYHYDDLDSITQSLTLRLDTTSNTWINQYQDSIVYTTPHLLAEEIFQVWDQGTHSWTNINRKVNTYDTSDYLTLHMEYTWSDTGNIWINSSRITYTNDLKGNPLNGLNENWNTGTQSWELYGQTIYTYNELEWPLSERQQLYNKISGEYEDHYMTYFFYFTSGVRQATSGNFWNPNTSEWITDSYYEIDSNNNFVQQYVKYHDYSSYEIFGGSKTANIYSSKLQLISVLNQSWSKTINDWINHEQTNYQYNEYKLLDTLIVQDWDTLSSAWVNTELSKYFYSEPFGINDNSREARNCNFANPITPGTIINCPGFSLGEVYTLRFYSLTGAMVYKKDFNGGESVTVSPSVKEGIYLMQFTDSKGRILSTNKVVVRK